MNHIYYKVDKGLREKLLFYLRQAHLLASRHPFIWVESEIEKILLRAAPFFFFIFPTCVPCAWLGCESAGIQAQQRFQCVRYINGWLNERGSSLMRKGWENGRRRCPADPHGFRTLSSRLFLLFAKFFSFSVRSFVLHGFFFSTTK